MVRAITAIILGVATLAAIWWLPLPWFDLFVFATAIGGLHEFGRMFLADRVERWATVAAGALVSAMMLFSGDAQDVLAMLAAAFFALALLFMWRTKELPGVALRLGSATMGVLYLGLAFSFWGPLREMALGQTLVLLAIVPACLCDTFAYLVGKSLGRHKLAPQVSPHKTVEGFAGALAGSLAGTFFVRWLLWPALPWTLAVSFAVVIWVVSPLGDLIESMFKRSCGVKDSGTIVPGHGGILDRLDALVFTAPAAFIFARYAMGL